MSFLEASEAVADIRSSSQLKRWEIYARLYKKVIMLPFQIIYLIYIFCFKRSKYTLWYMIFDRLTKFALSIILTVRVV